MLAQALFAGALARGRSGVPVGLATVALTVDPERTAIAIASAAVPSLAPRAAGELWRLAQPRHVGLG